MSYFTLEWLLDSPTVQTLDTELYSHVHKRLERFVYQQNIASRNTALAYVEYKPLTVNDLMFSDLSYVVPANRKQLISSNINYYVTPNKNFNSPYNDVLATYKTFVDDQYQTKPLFYRHALPVGVTEAKIYELRNGNKNLIDRGYVIDLNDASIYTNYQNAYDPDSDNYSLFWVVYTANGLSVEELLNPIPATKEATWEDIDLETGKLRSEYPLFFKEATASGTGFMFNRSTTWYVKPLERSLIQPQVPSSDDIRESWFVQFTAGNFYTNVNNKVRHYWLPEYDAQNFSPYKPLKHDVRNTLTKVTTQVYKTARTRLAIKPLEGLHCEVRVSNFDNQLIKIYTTDQSKNGLRYSNTNVFYQTDQIASWDNEGGYISFSESVLDSWKLEASVYYNLHQYIYTGFDANPLLNKDIKNCRVIFYCIPDCKTGESAIHYLLVNNYGRIVHTSQSQGITYDNQKLVNIDGSYNAGHVIGMLYQSVVLETNWLDMYAAGRDNIHGYMLLCELGLKNHQLITDAEVVAVTSPGGVFTTEAFDTAIASSPYILQTDLYYGPDGCVLPKHNVIVVNIPAELLVQYGGDFTPSELQTNLGKNLPVSAYAVYQYEYPYVEVSQDVTEPGIELDIDWPGPGWEINLYQADSPTGTFTLIGTLGPDATPVNYVYNDFPDSGTIVWYQARLSRDGIEYPAKYTLSVEAP